MFLSLLNIISDFKLFQNKPLFLTCLQYKSSENTVGKEKLLVASNFSFFPVFSTLLENFFTIFNKLQIFIYSFSLEDSKICRLGQGKLNIQSKEEPILQGQITIKIFLTYFCPSFWLRNVTANQSISMQKHLDG